MPSSDKERRNTNVRKKATDNTPVFVDLRHQYCWIPLTLIVLINACATPGPRDSDALVAIDADVRVPSSWPHVEIPLLTRPEPRTEFDCNANGIDDAFDLAGIIPRGPYPVGDSPDHLTDDDFDGDGDIDIAVSNYDDETVTILWQRSFRRFDRSDTFNLDTRPEWDHVSVKPACIAASDLDGDNDIDLVVGPDTAPYKFVIIMQNNGSGDFELEELLLGDDLSDSYAPKCVTVVDIDNDGDPDILTTSGIHTISGSPLEKTTLFRNPGDGIFSTREIRETFMNDIRNLTTADLNGDSFPEVIFDGRDEVGTIENETGSGTAFSDWLHVEDNLPGVSAISALATADIESDDGIDLVVLRDSGAVNIIPNAGGRLSIPTTEWFDYSIGSGGLGIGTANVDGDDNTDVIAPEQSTNTVAILHNFLHRELRPAIHLPVSDSPTGLYVGNLDSDNRPEIAVSHRGTNDVWILHVRPNPVSFDCNTNDRPDSCDIRDNPGIDEDQDGVPDSCGGMLPSVGSRPPWL